jgi:hypothetical protein
MDGFYTDEIEKILGFPDTAERPDEEVFSVIFSLGMDAENREEAKYAYDLLISLMEKKSADVRAYALASLAIMAVQKKRKMLENIFDKKKVFSLIERELVLCKENKWARATLTDALSDLKKVYNRI